MEIVTVDGLYGGFTSLDVNMGHDSGILIPLDSKMSQ